MNLVAQKQTGTVAIDDVDLHYETRGHGPAVLLISGATGDAGHFDAAADLLASGRTVITYDRRGNSRSRWTGVTSLEQQADDAVALLRHLGVAPAIVFGTSGGAIIALKLATRSPEAAREVIVHEPPFMGALPDAAQLGSALQAQIETALATAGARGAMELFIRENAGSDAFDRLDLALRERMLANGPWFFGQELAMFMSWLPSRAELASLRVPVRVLAGRDNRGNYHYRAAEWLAQAMGHEVIEIPGTHAPYLAQPGEFAAALTVLLGDTTAATR